NDWKLTVTPPEKDDVVINTFNTWTQTFPTMNTGFIVLQHDLYPETVIAAIKVLKLAVKVNGLNMTTVPQCVGDTKPYLEVGGSPNFIKGKQVDLVLKIRISQAFQVDPESASSVTW
ncbi:11459_t:CDS:2, partial [Cetraspora pellucida]